MVKYKIGNGDFISQEEFFARLKKAIKTHNNNIDGTMCAKRTMKKCKSDLDLRGYCKLWLVKDMNSACPFFMADESVFAIYDIIIRHATHHNNDLEPLYAFKLAKILIEYGCRIVKE